MTLTKAMPAPEGVGQRPIQLLEVLLFIREQALQGRPLWFFLGGEAHVNSMVAYIQGYRTACRYNGVSDEDYAAFITWLRDVKRELPGEGWAARYLTDCGGDHERAILKLLDFVAEYKAHSQGNTT